ncbi:MAG: RnfABCDGE type electron transport complex subunit G [candidate division WOR-3 bacterium]|nr:RnfABCDGE type electron transport complex subunit G [candidate division WOR-3 bacterium]
MKSLTWMVISLFLVCLISAVLLSRVYTITKGQIEKQTRENLLFRLSDVLPNAEIFQEVIKDTVWLGLDEQNQKIGIVFKVGPRGYGGPIPILVGLGSDLTIKKIYIGSASEGLKETPGLGAQIQSPQFKDQFCNKSYQELKLVKDGGDIQAITGATISSRAVVDGISLGIEKYKHYLQTDSIKQPQSDTIYEEKH